MGKLFPLSIGFCGGVALTSLFFLSSQPTTGPTLCSIQVHTEQLNEYDSFAVGTVMAFIGIEEDCPDGWMVCNGQEIDASEYAELRQLLVGPDPTRDEDRTLTLPDFRGMYILSPSLLSPMWSSVLLRRYLPAEGSWTRDFTEPITWLIKVKYQGEK